MNEKKNAALTSDERIAVAKNFIVTRQIKDDDLKQSLYLAAIENGSEASLPFTTKDRNIKALNLILEETVEKHMALNDSIHSREMSAGDLFGIDDMIWTMLFGRR